MKYVSNLSQVDISTKAARTKLEKITGFQYHVKHGHTTSTYIRFRVVSNLKKNSNHNSGYTVPGVDPQRTRAVSRFDSGQEVIQKAVLYRVPDSSIPGGFAMKLESYLDMTRKGQHFQKVLEYLDNGKWGPTRGGNGVCCDGNKQYEFVVMNAARCVMSFRCYNMREFLFKDCSVRSIDPTKPLFPSILTST